MRKQLIHFLDTLAYERGLSENTRIAYEQDLSCFVLYLEKQAGIRSFSHVTRDHVAGFLLREKQLGLSVATRCRRLAAIRVFFGTMVSEGYLQQNVTSIIDAPKRGRILPRTLSEQEIVSLLNSIDGVTVQEIRDRCMIELFYAAGLRVSEVVALRVTDVQIEEGVVRCIGKGNKQRLVPIGRTACQWLARYLTEARPTFARRSEDQSALFLTRLGAPFTRQGIFDMLVKRAHAAGLAREISPHVLRHCFATHLLAHGVQIRAIQEMLGHADIATTQIYTHVDNGHVTSVHAQFHPRNRSRRTTAGS